MTHNSKIQKPKNLVRAEVVMGLWTAWICLFGIFQSLNAIPEIQKMMTEQLHEPISIEPQTMINATLALYAIMALSMVWMIYKIDQGKNWARITMFLTLIMQGAATLMPPYHGAFYYLTALPDVGLLSYSVYLLYTKPCQAWFQRKKESKV